MASSASNRTVRIGKLHQALKKHYKPVEIERRPLLQQVLYACCLEDAPFEVAEEVLAKLEQGYFDWNEVRVTTVSELAEVMSDLPDSMAAAARLKKILHSLFEIHYSFDLEGIAKLALGKAIEQLEKVPSMTPFVLGHVIQHALAGHQIPIDESAAKVLELCDIASAAECQKKVVAGLERAIPKSKGVEFATLLHACAVDYRLHPQSTNARAVILAVFPDALLPGSAAAKKLAAEQKKAAAKAQAEAEKAAAAKAQAEAAKAKAEAAKAEAAAAKAAKAAAAAKPVTAAKPGGKPAPSAPAKPSPAAKPGAAPTSKPSAAAAKPPATAATKPKGEATVHPAKPATGKPVAGKTGSPKAPGSKPAAGPAAAKGGAAPSKPGSAASKPTSAGKPPAPAAKGPTTAKPPAAKSSTAAKPGGTKPPAAKPGGTKPPLPKPVTGKTAPPKSTSGEKPRPPSGPDKGKTAPPKPSSSKQLSKKKPK
jgi:endonuclease III